NGEQRVRVLVHARPGVRPAAGARGLNDSSVSRPASVSSEMDVNSYRRRLIDLEASLSKTPQRGYQLRTSVPRRRLDDLHRLAIERALMAGRVGDYADHHIFATRHASE